MLKRINLITLIFIIILQLSVLANNDKTGTTSLSFLKLKSGVRAISLGNTFASIADDVNTIYWNPAGLAQLRSSEINWMNANWLEGINYSSFTYNIPLVDGHSLGFGATFVYFGSIQETTAASPQGTGNFISSQASNVIFGYGWKASEDLSIGTNIKFASENIDSSIQSANIFDLGLIYEGLWESRIALVLENNELGGDKASNLPRTTTIGISKKYDNLLIGIDLGYPNDSSNTTNIGIEYAFNSYLDLRCGYSSRNENNAGGNLSLGVGLNLGLKLWKFDFAYVPYDMLGNTYRFSIGHIL